MKVLYDISVLGIGHYHPRGRTGVFRVIENIAYGLANSKKCDLCFWADQSFQGLNEALDYLEFNSQFDEIALPHSIFRRLIYKKTRNLNTKISNESINDSQFKQFYWKAFRKSLNYVDRVIAAYTNYLINPNILANINVFHSPFYPLPEITKRVKNLNKFITIYDLIPILYPHFFEFNQDHVLYRILESLKPDNWAICISHATKNDLCNYLKNIEPSRVFVTHLAASELFYRCLDADKIAITHKKYHIPDVPYILSLSTLEPRKNIDHTIRCFAHIIQQEHIKDLYLVLVGTKGWDFDKIFEEISKHYFLKDRIIITGYVADEDLAALYSGALAFVYPSFYEGFGLPPLEAMQCGVPVITSNTSSLPEVVGDAGIMLNPTDTDGLCHSILEIYNSLSLRESMSLKSLERAKQFSWEKCTQETINAYITTLSN